MNTIIASWAWCGVIAILFAYALVSFGYTTPQSVLFQALNLFGSLGIVFDSWHDKDWQPTVLNIVWCVIALVALFRILFI